MNAKHWFIQVLIWIDQGFNLFITPLSGSAWADETMSSRSFRAWRDGKFFGFTMKPIDLLFFWQKIREDAIGHCHQAYLNEREKAGLPPEMR